MDGSNINSSCALTTMLLTLFIIVLIICILNIVFILVQLYNRKDKNLDDIVLQNDKLSGVMAISNGSAFMLIIAIMTYLYKTNRNLSTSTLNLANSHRPYVNVDDYVDVNNVNNIGKQRTTTSRMSSGNTYDKQNSAPFKMPDF